MRDIIKKVPIPTAGVALGLAALGNLLQPYAEIAHIACGALSLFLVAMLVAKLIMFPSMLREDMKNSVFASVSATFFMTLMQLAGYLAPVAIVPAFGLWCSAVAGHFVLMTWFTLYYIRRFKLTEVFPTYFHLLRGHHRGGCNVSRLRRRGLRPGHFLVRLCLLPRAARRGDDALHQA